MTGHTDRTGPGQTEPEPDCKRLARTVGWFTAGRQSFVCLVLGVLNEAAGATADDCDVDRSISIGVSAVISCDQLSGVLEDLFRRVPAEEELLTVVV